MSGIKAIETVYNGYRFRSRLEARWAVFFDAAGIEYEYEPDGFEFYNCETDTTDRYLPDFYLPQFDCYAEVKPSVQKLIECQSKISGAIDFNSTPISEKGILILGQIPYWEEEDINPKFLFFYWDKGVGLDYAVIAKSKYGQLKLFREQQGFIRSAPELPIDDFFCKPELYMKSHGIYIWKDGYCFELSGGDWELINKFMMPCYKKARQARFEFGERG